MSDARFATECAGNQQADGTHVDNAPALAALLGAHCMPLGIPLPSPGTIHPMAIISRWPIERKSCHGFGVRISVPSAHADEDAYSVWVFNCHLPYFPYQPYQLAGIPYHDAPMLRTADEAIASAEASRATHVQLLINDMKASCTADDFVCLTGDFNEPSHRDWTDEAALAGLHPIACQWPSARTIEQNTGLVVWFSL